jgi:EAL domain-containing protein (putative c-di-GMP-specific phosphodiesterase class I)
VARLRIETALHSAIEKNQFRLQYQPIISLDSYRTVGFEALLRWNHPVMGAISPSEFIGIAEEAGLMFAIGRWVLEEACREAAKWTAEQGDGAPFVSVNISAKQLLRGALVAEIDHILAEVGLPASHLRIEITETAVITDLHAAKEIVLQLKERGVLVSIDDFGTGYAGLQYLRELPVSTLKINSSLVSLMTDGTEKFPQAIVTLAHELGLDVVAEGIETAELVDRLKAVMCESGQGHYFAEPLDPEDVVDYMRAGANPAVA